MSDLHALTMEVLVDEKTDRTERYFLGVFSDAAIMDITIADEKRRREPYRMWFDKIPVEIDKHQKSKCPTT